MRISSRAVLPFAILAAGGISVAIVVATSKRPEAKVRPILAPIVEVVTIDPRPLQLVVEGQGTVMPRTESDLVAQVSGEVMSVSPALVPGGFFDQGEVLLRIESIDYEANLESARASLARAQSEARRARKDLDRQTRLADRSVASESRIDDAENAQRVASAGLREARAQLGRAERELERCELRAPYAGRVRSKSVDVGQFVNRGNPLARLYAVDYAEVRLPIPDRELRYLDLPLAYRDRPAAPRDASEDVASVEGEEASGISDEELEGSPYTGPLVELETEFAGERHVWEGRIVRSEGEIDPLSRMVTVVARVEDPYGRSLESDRPPLSVGLFVEARIQGRIIPGAVLLPRAAIHEGDQVLVLDAESRLVFRKVDVLRRQGNQLVIGGGLAPGEKVCTTPLPGAVDGMAVRPTQETASLAHRAEVAK